MFTVKGYLFYKDPEECKCIMELAVGNNYSSFDNPLITVSVVKATIKNIKQEHM